MRSACDVEHAAGLEQRVPAGEVVGLQVAAILAQQLQRMLGLARLAVLEVRRARIRRPGAIGRAHLAA
jgi:hypothetical protein